VATGPGPDGPVSARWTFEAQQAGEKPPVVADGRLYVGVHDERPAVVALDAATGTERWRTRFDEGVGYPDAAAAVADDVVVAPFDELLVGLAPATGDVLWRQRPGDGITAPVLAGGTGYVAVGDPGSVVAFDPSTGEVQWQRQVGEWLSGGPAVADGSVYAMVGAEDSGRLVALDAGDGVARWSVDLDGEGSARPVVADGSVYAPTEAGLHAVSVDGERRFTFGFPTREASAVRYYRGGSAPAVADGSVYVGAPDGRVYAVDATSGEEEWSFWTWAAVSGDPVVAGDAVYVGSDDTFVYCLDRSDGTRRWEFDTRGTVDGAGGAVVDGVLYISTRDDALYALEGP
jgi:outer membrane protein assembly factor BamB